MLIKCPDCGKEFSDMALSCPNCGRPNIQVQDNASEPKDNNDGLNHEPNENTNNTQLNKNKRKNTKLSIVSLVFVCIGTLFLTGPIVWIGILLGFIDFFIHRDNRKFTILIFTFVIGVVGVIFSQVSDFSETDTTENVLPAQSTEVDIDANTEEISNENETQILNDITTGQKNALESAQNYLRSMPFSYNGLIEQLEYEQYTKDDATYAADNCGADWNEQALRSAQNYLKSMAFSYNGLVEQLEYEGFTNEQAIYGVDNCGADWNEQAAKSAKSYLDSMSFSRDSLIEQLEYEGFTHDQAVYGVEQNGY